MKLMKMPNIIHLSTLRFFTLVIYLLASGTCGSKYHHEVLDPSKKFHLYWTTEKKDWIVFRLEVQTRGYVALGLSPNGGMPGSDIAIGWVKEGKAFVQDRYAYKKAMPELDDQQDWDLLGGYENETHTVLHIKRRLITCDGQDYPITNDTSRVIYAYHEEDPTKDGTVLYHGPRKRGSKSIMLLQPFVRSGNLPSDIKIWDIRSPNVTIPDDIDTTYWCKIVKAPLLNKKHHVIQIAPLISEGNSPFVHHMVLYRCLGATARELEPHAHHHGHPCYVPDTPSTYRKCESVYAAWGVGGVAIIMPETAGLPLGDKANLYFLLEIHYDNMEFKSGVVDQSGFRIYYTPQLRRFDAMTLMIGASIDPCIVVPPGRRKFVVAGHADPRCLGPAIPPEGIKIFGVFLHSHLLGRKMKLRHFRNNIELPYIASDQNYDFNYQDYRYLSEEVTVKPGDHLIVECTYDSTGRNRTTFGGLGTEEEMCLAFILYYPRIARARALSSPTCDLVKSLAGMEIREASAEDENSNYTFYQHFHTNNPWDSNYAGIAEEAMRFGFHKPQCFLGDGVRLKMINFVTYPKNHRDYSKPTTCSYLNSAQELWSDDSSPLSGSSTLKYTLCFLLNVLLFFLKYALCTRLNVIA